MRWRVRKPGAKFRALRRWHKWFAWYPVRVPTTGKRAEATKVWLEIILRKGTLKPDFMEPYLEWEYKLPNE